MEVTGEPVVPPALPRVPTRVPGLDTVTHGGLVEGGAYLVVGSPGTGKTTLGNQIAHAHAADGGTAVFATLLGETHDRMLAHLRGFGFFDPALVGRSVHYYNLLSTLEEGGLDGVLTTLRQTVRERGARLLVVDGTAAVEDLAPSGFDYRRFAQRLQAQAGLLNCTTLLLSSHGPEDIGPLGTHVDGVLVLTNEPVDGRDARLLRVVKLRGSDHFTGRHEFALVAGGVEVYPRLEAIVATSEPPAYEAGERKSVGLPALDAMLGGGLLPGTSTLVLGTPGAGKTLLGLHFAAEGARGGEHVLFAGFHESEDRLVETARGVGLDLRRHLDDGLVRVLWRTPLELPPDAWARDLLAAVAEHRPARLVVDALSDVQRLIMSPSRQPSFVVALSSALRLAGVTSLLNVELDTIVGPELAVPIPAISAAVDNGLLLRHFEVRSRLHRLVSVLKARQTAYDPAIREFAIDAHGVAIGDAFDGVAALLTGEGKPVAGGSGETAPEDGDGA